MAPGVGVGVDKLALNLFCFFNSGLALTLLPKRIRKIVHQLTPDNHPTYDKCQTRVSNIKKKCY